MKSLYGWTITRDFLAESGNGKSDVGTMGPRDLDPETRERLIAGDGERFRMKDDDGEIYYVGLLIVNEESDPEARFAPLDDYGMPGAGCTSIEYRDASGKWAPL